MMDRADSFVDLKATVVFRGIKARKAIRDKANRARRVIRALKEIPDFREILDKPDKPVDKVLKATRGRKVILDNVVRCGIWDRVHRAEFLGPCLVTCI
jgi:hypothetical protein